MKKTIIGNRKDILPLNTQYELNNTLTPEISLIIPVFNGEITIRHTLEALVRLAGVVFEAIFVDDCSTDRTCEIISEYPFTLISLPKSIGGALARNLGSKRAKAPILFHTDADVEIEFDTLKRVIEKFQKKPELDALFGSYSVKCPHKNFWSQYKNLHHHFIHQISRQKTINFWSGCGAVKTKAFFAIGGYRDYEFLYDIDFGYRLNKAGYKTEIIPDIQVIHHKYYNLFSLLKSDFLGRAIPWVELMWEHKIFKNDMNTRNTYTTSVFLVYLSIIFLFLPIPWPLRVAGFFLSLFLVTLINLRWAKFCYQQKGVLFAIGAMLMEWFYFFYCGLGVICGTFLYLYKLLFKSKK